MSKQTLEQLGANFILAHFFLGAGSILITGVAQFLLTLSGPQCFLIAGGMYVMMMASFLYAYFKGDNQDEQ